MKKKKKNFFGLLYASDVKIQNLVENDSLHNPSSLIFTFRLKFSVYTRKQ